MSRSDPRLYLAPDETVLAAGTEHDLAPGQAHYLGNVMRHSVGDAVIVFNGRDGEWCARLTALRKDRGRIRLEQCLRPQTATTGHELIFAPLKRDTTELVLRMGTELGVTRFHPVLTERTNTHRLNMDRLQLIVQEAAEQCERRDIPEIMPLSPLRSVIDVWPRDVVICAALERRDSVKGVTGPVRALLIGPEGGFSDAEATWLQGLPFVQGLSLGPLILRAETAVSAGLARLAAW